MSERREAAAAVRGAYLEVSFQKFLVSKALNYQEEARAGEGMETGTDAEGTETDEGTGIEMGIEMLAKAEGIETWTTTSPGMLPGTSTEMKAGAGTGAGGVGNPGNPLDSLTSKI